MSDQAIIPETKFFDFSTALLPEVLALQAPPFSSVKESFRQLRYVARYAEELGCQSMAVENHYIDRDYIEDHSVFYSKSLHPYPNYCRRVHFFSKSLNEIQARFRAVVAEGIKGGETAYRKLGSEFSDEAYLGFCVVRPLDGSPVGRTVMKTYPEMPPDSVDKTKFRRDFSPTRGYPVHVLGVELSVRGLAFQQQDVGVSACATTAIWSSLQKTREHEDVASATPAQITMLASKHSLAFGRPMPSEGLSLDQMCQSVQAVGLSPNIFRVDDAATSRGYLYSAIRSGFAPVLILKSGHGTYHAVTAVGMKVRAPHSRTMIGDSLDDLAGDLLALYIHDDRCGPYLKAEIANFEHEPKRLDLNLVLRDPPDEKLESWQVTHLLIPLHSKIRLSFAGLRDIAQQVAEAAGLGYMENVNWSPDTKDKGIVTFEDRIMRSHRYIESLITSSRGQTADRIEQLASMIALARYLGVIRLRSKFFAPLDVLVDTTSTRKNAHCLAVVAAGSLQGHTPLVGRFLADGYRCRFIA